MGPTAIRPHRKGRLYNRPGRQPSRYICISLFLSSCLWMPDGRMLDVVRYLTGAVGPSGFGSKSTAEQVTEASPFSLLSSTAIITGATSGIGAETARVLAKRGVRLVLPARNVKAAEETRSRIREETPSAEVIVMSLDLSSMASVRSFVAEFERLGLPLNILINNAGKFCHRRAVSEDGIEMTFATNHLGHFLLTKLLLKKMIQTAEVSGVEGRIVNVSSSIHGWYDGDDVTCEELTRQKKRYDPTRAYALSKLANVLHAKELAKRLKKLNANVTANSVHPGIVRTRLTREREGFITDLAFFSASKLLKTIPQAAATTCYVATHPRVSGVSGRYFADCNEASTSRLGASETAAVRLWEISEELTTATPERHVVRSC
ncbi:short-chain dehydrogenase TIC 32 B, chloroplastic-like isoform X2 [Nymphaea colorata]|nr:short-chain dehydrogenase TIC 32 B, chloroplastic-like isoform X2 [Nymphaea colorata]